jgi:multimeric flavodoxin WrbA
MKLFVINGSPRKKCNTAQLLDAFVDGAKSAEPEVEITSINVYDYQFSGCRSCFACQMTENRDYLECKIKDDVHDLLDEARHADGIVIGSPIYFLDISAQTKCFLERLNYPGPSEKKIPSAFLYTMNADEESFQKFHIDDVIGTTRFYMKNNFGMEPDTVYSFNTFQYNDRENLNEHFRRNVKAKLQHREEQFSLDLQAAYNAGRKMVETITVISTQSGL